MIFATPITQVAIDIPLNLLLSLYISSTYLIIVKTIGAKLPNNTQTIDREYITTAPADTGLENTNNRTLPRTAIAVAIFSNKLVFGHILSILNSPIIKLIMTNIKIKI